MYCPQCGMQNTDGTKFCRGCGTNLEPVALALDARPNSQIEQRAGDNKSPEPPQDWIKKKGEAIRDIGQGVILLAVSLLIALLASFALPGNIPWFAVWTVFFGWLAAWGAIALATGFGHFIQSKSHLRHLYPQAGEVSTSPLDRAERGDVKLDLVKPDLSARPAFQVSPPASVTENTTEPLRKPGVRDARE